MSDTERWWQAYLAALTGMHAYGQSDESYSIAGADRAAAQAAGLALTRWMAIGAQAEPGGETAAAEERRSILHETGSTVTRACAALVRLSAPDDVDDAYVPRAAVVDIAMGLKRDMDALRSRSAAGGQGRGGGNG